MCFLSWAFIQTSFLMKYFLECQQFITSQVCLTCEILFCLDIFIDFFSVKSWSTMYLQEDAFILLHATLHLYIYMYMYIN